MKQHLQINPLIPIYLTTGLVTGLATGLVAGLATGCKKALIPSGYDVLEPSIAISYWDNVLQINHDQIPDSGEKIIRFVPPYSNNESFLPQYASMLMLSEEEEAERLYFRITTNGLEDKENEEDCVEIYVDAVPLGELNPETDYFGVTGNCKGIFSNDLEKILLQKTQRFKDDSMHSTFSLAKVNSLINDYLEARYLENLNIAESQL